MRVRWNVSYYVTNFSGWWWVPGLRKWMQFPDHYETAHGYSSGVCAKTLKRAKKIAERCPAEMTILKRFRHKGKVWEREYVLREKA